MKYLVDLSERLVDSLWAFQSRRRLVKRSLSIIKSDERVEMDNPIRVAVMGCNGRMGKVLLEAITNTDGVVVG
ncbi:MAG: hypothetical protein ACRCUF_00520, partial [Aeromonas sobria]